MASTYYGEAERSVTTPSTLQDPPSDLGQVSTARRSLANGRPGGDTARINVGQGERALSIVVGAGLLTLLRRPSLPRVALALGGGALLHRGLTGHCPAYGALSIDTSGAQKLLGAGKHAALEVRRSITIRRAPDELHHRFRDPRQLAQIMGHFADVAPTGEGAMHWKIRTPLGKAVEWKTTMIEERQGELMRWRSTEDASVPNEGALSFSPAPRDFGTTVTLHWRFQPPLGPLTGPLEKLLGSAPRVLAGVALRRFKSLAETGEIPVNDMNDGSSGPSANGASAR